MIEETKDNGDENMDGNDQIRASNASQKTYTLHEASARARLSASDHLRLIAIAQLAKPEVALGDRRILSVIILWDTQGFLAVLGMIY